MPEAPIEQVLGASFPWCAEWAAELKSCSQAYVEAKQSQNVLDYDDLLLYWAQTMKDPAPRRRHRAAGSTTCWSTSTRTLTGCNRRSCWR
jgi:superfamily I DNA/RNA helicase